MHDDPPYYRRGSIPVWEVLIDWQMPYFEGSAIAHIVRAGRKPGETYAEALANAIRCLEIARVDALQREDDAQALADSMRQLWQTSQEANRNTPKVIFSLAEEEPAKEEEPYLAQLPAQAKRRVGVALHIMHGMIERFKADRAIDLSQDPMALERLYEASEIALRALANKGRATVNLPFIGADQYGPKHLLMDLTNSNYDAAPRRIPEIEHITIEVRDPKATAQAAREAGAEREDAFARFRRLHGQPEPGNQEPAKPAATTAHTTGTVHVSVLTHCRAAEAKRLKRGLTQEEDDRLQDELREWGITEPHAMRYSDWATTLARHAPGRFPVEDCH